MKQKYNKKYLKTNFISFIIALIIFGSIGVYAAITFPSNDVSYDNSVSGLKSTSVKDAIDELYTECTTTLAGEQIIEDAGLIKDEYEDRYFFTGANPNNYITFNGEKAGWQILSVEGDGTIKIIKAESIGKMAWDTFETYGDNDWTRPATLNTYLNETYYNQLTDVAQKQIIKHDFMIGGEGVAQSILDIAIADLMNYENSKIWNGKIALLTASEYIRANSNKSDCGEWGLVNENYNICPSTNWILRQANCNYWVLFSAIHQIYGYDMVANIADYASNGQLTFASGMSNTQPFMKLDVRPALYLNSNVQITGGTGTQSDPYEVE